MIAYVPIPNNMVPNIRTVDSLLAQVETVEMVECGDLRDKKDRQRYNDIGIGRINAMKKAVERGDEFFVINNSGALHKNANGIEKCVLFLKNNPEFAGVSLPNKVPIKLEQAHVKQECCIYRTSDINGIWNFIIWDAKTCECVKIRNAIVRYKKKRFGYLEKTVSHISDIGCGFAKRILNGGQYQPIGI